MNDFFAKEVKIIMKQNIIAVILLVTVIAGAGGFFAGTKYQQNKRGQFMTQTGNGTRPGGMMNPQSGNGQRGGFRPVSGEIIKSDATSVTVKLTDGSSKIILLTEATQINKAETGTAEDLTAGTMVAVFGSENADGSVTAQNVQVNPTGVGQVAPEPSK